MPHWHRALFRGQDHLESLRPIAYVFPLDLSALFNYNLIAAAAAVALLSQSPQMGTIQAVVEKVGVMVSVRRINSILEVYHLQIFGCRKSSRKDFEDRTLVYNRKIFLWLKVFELCKGNWRTFATK